MSRPSQRTVAVHLEPWGADDLRLAERLFGDPLMMGHLGGPETPDKIAERHRRFQRNGDAGSGRVFKIVADANGEGVGSVGYWPRTWREVYEMGCSVGTDAPLPPRLSLGGQRSVQRDLPQSRLQAGRGVRLRVPAWTRHAMQRLATRPHWS